MVWFCRYRPRRTKPPISVAQKLSSVLIFRLGVFFMAYGMVLPLSPPPHKTSNLCSPEAFFGAYFSFGRVFHGLWCGFAVVAPSAQNLTCPPSTQNITSKQIRLDVPVQNGCLVGGPG